MRYRNQTSLIHPTYISLLLLAMVCLLSLLPKLVYAEETKDTLPLYTLTPKEVGVKVAEAIQTTGISNMVEATVKVDDANTVFGADQPMDIEVKALQADAKTKNWTANILFKNGDTVMSAIPMQGKFQPVIELPALLKSKASGDVIAAEDIGMQKFPTHFSAKDIITDAADLVGKSVKRSITANRPIRAHEIATPTVMKKNDIIQLSYNNSTLHISTSGQAMADASVGEVIEFKNLNSNQLIRAQVKDAKNASVVPFVQTSSLENTNAKIN